MTDLLALVVVIARIALAIVFVVAAAAKLRDRAGARQAVVDFGLPSALVNPIAQLLPYSEIILALGLIPAATGWWAASGVFLMLAGFTAGMVVNLLRGRKPACHCFGELDAEPIGWHSIIRNGVLGLAALLVILLGFVVGNPELIETPAIASRLTGLTLTGAMVALTGVAVLTMEAFYIMRLKLQNDTLSLRVETLEENLRKGVPVVEAPQLPSAGLPVGAIAPAFQLSDLSGRTVTLETLQAAGHPVMLMFTDPNCGPCQRLMPDLGMWQSDYEDEITIALVSRGTVEENLAKTREFGLRNVMLQQDREVREAYRVHGTPSAVIIRYDGRIGSETAAGAEAITILATQALTQAVQVTPGPSAANRSARQPVGA